MLAPIDRPSLTAAIAAALQRSPAVALLGRRQVGKTTVARQFVPAGSGHYLDLEDPTVLAQLAAPMSLLAGLHRLVAINEVQRAPDLFPVLRVLLDRDDSPARFCCWAAPRRRCCARRANRRPAGHHRRRRFQPARPGRCIGVAPVVARRFPRAYLAPGDAASRAWRRDFMRLVIERDLPALGLQASMPATQRFLPCWPICTARSGMRPPRRARRVSTKAPCAVIWTT